MIVNTEELISVIVPIYKVEEYLDRCIYSIVNQTYKYLQIILVDDGSPDSCPAICDRWSEQDSRIEVIHKQNSGLGMSRNAGLQRAKGKFVCFVDSDDYIATDTLEKLYTYTKVNSADVCYYGCIDVIDGIETQKKPPEKLLFVGEEIRTELGARLIGSLPYETDTLFSGMSACYAFYSLSLLTKNNITFHSEREMYISEDLIFNLEVCQQANVVVIFPESLYYYVLRKSDSLRSTYRGDRFEKSLKMYKKLLDFSYIYDLKTDGKIRAQKYLIQTTIACTKMEVLVKKDVSETLKVLRGYMENDILSNVINQYPIKLLPFKQKIFCYCIKYKCNLGMFLLAKIQNRTLKNRI